jgi:tellurium resistance protein TerD
MSEDLVKCPRCSSTQLTADKKGFGLGKALGGGLLLGPIGLLGGFMGSKKVLITCLKCGHQWKVGK